MALDAILNSVALKMMQMVYIEAVISQLGKSGCIRGGAL